MNDNRPTEPTEPSEADLEMTAQVGALQDMILKAIAEPVVGNDVRLIILALIGAGANIAMATGLPGGDFSKLLRTTADQLEPLWPEASKQYLDA